MMLMFIIHISFATTVRVIKVVNGVSKVSMKYGLDVDIAKVVPYWIYLEIFSEHFYVCLALFVFEFVFVFHTTF